ARLNVGIASLAEAQDPALLDRNVALHNAPPVDHQCVGDDRVGAFLGDALALTHAVANDLPASELDFLAVDRLGAFDLGHQLGGGEAHAIARGPAAPSRVGAASDLQRLPRFAAGAFFVVSGFFAARLSSGPIAAPLNPCARRAPGKASSSTVF